MFRCVVIANVYVRCYVRFNAQGKVKVVPVLFLIEHHAMKVYCGSGIMAPLTI
jgi:hypothetical protein